jgi:protein-arginine kinase activator protein McsA
MIDNLTHLNELLRSAVDAEDYEQAAVLDDQISAVENMLAEVRIFS